jgi:spermidine/putrescine ABC transporter ATP-binding subunit
VALELRHLRKRFGEVTAVDGITLTVRDGEFFSLLGPSGCGKTTILRIVAGIVAPDEGRVILGGEEITHRPLYARNTTLVFQNYALFPHLSVYDNIAFGLVMRGERKPAIRARVEEALALVRLPGIGARYPAQLSGGQQQRVALARALVVRPAVLLLDEPLSNLDARLREEMRLELREIQREVGITTILVTHDIHEAFALSDRLAVLSAGRVEQVGTPNEVYTRPTTRFVAEFAGASNHFEAQVVSLADGLAVVRTDEGLEVRLALGVRPTAVGRRLAVMIRPERVRIRSAGGELPNRYPGVIERATYLGGVTSYRVRIGETRILAEAPNTDDGVFQVGDRVTVEWGERDCAVQG